ncbi:hypothetical protein [Polyangium sorediatum]|uniref:Lipoprotein n=1 Tax=Polyangium sorediatum TaxID=889274 RepID=A0ABT6P8I1_9BACT|nr:hypothetical protein [Polyangium sorediatum]MDI1436917.1 hypothetical protein [Polyangium sorediatum]
MRRAFFLFSSFALFTASALMLGCSAASTDGTFTGGQGGDAGQGQGGSAGTGGQGGTAGPGGAGGDGGAGGFEFPTDGGTPDPELPAEVFGHSPDRLYKLEPYTKEVSVVGYFEGCGDVIDIAIDKDSKIVGTSFYGLYWIDKTTAKCTEIASGSYPNSLSFVPAGTLDPNHEVLVGYENATYVRIDTVTGVMTTVGSIGGGYSSSGDIVSVKGGGTYLTVKGNGCDDCLIEVNPKTGALVKNWGPVGNSDVFGIAFWAGSVYGFTNSGFLFELTFNPNGTSVTSTPIAIPGNPNLQFWGAGSTTFAPVEPPPK